MSLCDLDGLREASGESETSLPLAQEIEVIFYELPGFSISLEEHVPNLRSLALIDTKLTSMGALGQLSASLCSLQLTKQGLTRMENLNLPNLVELMLQDNAIQRIEGLSGCPKLRRLWLSRNRIKKLENLHHVGNLRELWVQQNLLRDLHGVESNSCLRDFEAGGNEWITELSQVEPLAELPNLSEVSFADYTFGDCPLVRLDRYREAMVCTMKQIKVLDDVVIHDSDRDAAEDEFLNRQLEFNDRMERLRYEHEAEVKKLQEERKTTIGETEKLRNNLLKSFEKLEEVVTRGRARIRSEQRRQRDLRQKNAEELKRKLNALQKEHAAFVKSLQKKDLAVLDEKERELQCFRKVARFQLNERNLQARLQQVAENNRVAFQVLKEEHFASQNMSMELQNLCIRLYNDQRPRESILKILRASKIFSPVFQRSITDEEAVYSPEQEDEAELYLVLSSLKEVSEVLTRGISTLVGSDKFITLFSDPGFAHLLHSHDSEPEGSETLSVTRVLLCRVDLRACTELKASKPMSIDDLQCNGGNMPSDCDVARYNCIEDDGTESSFYLVRKTCVGIVVPEVYVVLQEVGLDPQLKQLKKQTNVSSHMLVKTPRLDTTLQDLVAFGQSAIRKGLGLNGLSEEDSSKLQDFEDRIEKLMRRYEDCIFQELDPETAATITAAESKAQEYKTELSSIRQQIEHEKTRQEQILREFGKTQVHSKRRR